MSQVFKAKKPDRRWVLEYTGRGLRDWHRDSNYHTYLAARINASIWNSLGYDARITDTWKESR